MHRLVRCKHERRCSHACEEDASFTDVKIKPQIGNGTRDVNNVMPGSADDFGDLRKTVR